MDIYLDEHSLRQAVAAAISSSMSVPQAAWSREFVEEALLAELTSSGPDSSSVSNTSSSSAVAHETSAPSSTSGSADNIAGSEHGGGEVTLAPAVLQLVEQYQQAAAIQQVSSSSIKAGATHTRSSSSRSKRSKAQHEQHSAGSADSSLLVDDAGISMQLHTLFGQLLQDNYQQVESSDVTAFGLKLLQELSRLVEAAAAAQQEHDEGVCQLCEREMPLTKHHLIPRDVHKDFKKKGVGFNDLQSGVMVCRPCHSAIHRAVKDNKELGLHYRTLEALKQHDEIARFAAWARRQRVTSKADIGSAHFRYRR